MQGLKGEAPSFIRLGKKKKKKKATFGHMNLFEL